MPNGTTLLRREAGWLNLAVLAILLIWSSFLSAVLDPVPAKSDR